MRILYVDCDSLRPDHLGCYGYGRDTSPAIDSVAAAGRRFTNYYASDAPCLPSRTALATGRFGIHTGVASHGGVAADPRREGVGRGADTGGEYRTLARTLLEAGYDTALVSPFPQRHGAWHFLDGFEEWVDTGGGGTERADVVAARAESWLDDHADEEDWYLHVNFWDPHTHYDTPESYGDPFADDPAPAWPDEATIRDHYEGYGPHSARDLHHGYLTGEGPPDLPRVPEEIDSREAFGRWIDGYDTGVRYMDDHVGDLLDALEAAGVREETLILVSADHGENQGELNVYGDHQTADELTCNVPLVVSGPGVEPGVDDGLHYNLDLAPTLADLVGGTPADGWDGESFADSLTEGADAGRDHLVVSQGAWACQRAVRWDDWLVVRTYHDGFRPFPPVMLFDVVDDPHETENLARERPGVVEAGLAKLEAWHAARTREAATGEAGGNPDIPGALRDPLFEVVREGGSLYTRANRESYLTRLRETGRDEDADDIEARGGVVARSVDDYLRG